jgi:hypothetical protein
MIRLEYVDQMLAPWYVLFDAFGTINFTSVGMPENAFAFDRDGGVVGYSRI